MIKTFGSIDINLPSSFGPLEQKAGRHLNEEQRFYQWGILILQKTVICTFAKKGEAKLASRIKFQ